MNRRQRLRLRWLRWSRDPRVWATAGAILLVASSLLSCYTLVSAQRSDCRQRTEGREAVRSGIDVAIDEVATYADLSDAERMDLRHRAQRRVRAALPPPNC